MQGAEGNPFVSDKKDAKVNPSRRLVPAIAGSLRQGASEWKGGPIRPRAGRAD